MAKPILTLDAIRLRRTPVYRDGRLVSFTTDVAPEVRGTLYLQDGGTMKLFQTLEEDEWRDLEALLARASARILSAMTAALTPEELRDTLRLGPEVLPDPIPHPTDELPDTPA